MYLTDHYIRQIPDCPRRSIRPEIRVLHSLIRTIASLKFPVNDFTLLSKLCLALAQNNQHSTLISYLKGSRACMKNHFRHLKSPIRAIFTPDSGYIARYIVPFGYAPFIWCKSSSNCEIYHALYVTSDRKHFSNTLQGL